MNGETQRFRAVMATSAKRAPQKLYGFALLTPFARIWEAPGGVKMTAVAVGLGDWLLGFELFWYAWLLLIVTSLADHLVGSARADIEERYDDNIRRAKALGKTINGLVPLLVYGGKLIAIQAGYTVPPIALAVAALLFLEEMRGLNRHKKALTGSPIPYVGVILDKVESIIKARMPLAEETPAPKLAPNTSEEPAAKAAAEALTDDA